MSKYFSEDFEQYDNVEQTTENDNDSTTINLKKKNLLKQQFKPYFIHKSYILYDLENTIENNINELIKDFYFDYRFKYLNIYNLVYDDSYIIENNIIINDINIINFSINLANYIQFIMRNIEDALCLEFESLENFYNSEYYKDLDVFLYSYNFLQYSKNIYKKIIKIFNKYFFSNKILPL